ncbi:unnamed protein product [Pieris macdunnoughi]|uniref:Uncharacterized protein n=1 Tax=Pieris macdunnoughi TaxID=345717 RepID=A0A821QKG7_9NEOP|nr:unnamed protein product [Pieris macdunnoughi]
MVKWQRTHNGQKLPKAEFSRIVGKVWEALNPDIIKNGFAKSGIYPFSRDAVPEHKLDPDAVKSSKIVQFDCPSQLTKPTTTKSVTHPNSKITVLQDIISLEPNKKVSREDIFFGQKPVQPREIILKTLKKKRKIKCEIKQTKPRQKKQNKQIEDNLSTDSEFSLHDSDTDEDFKTYIEMYLKDKDSEEEIENMSFGFTDIQYYEEKSHKFTEQDWVLVKFSAKKSLKHYVGQIVKINNDIPTVKYLRKTQTKQGLLHFVYPNVDDICELLHVEDIISILPKPTVSRRGQISFNVDFGSFNIQ